MILSIILAYLTLIERKYVHAKSQERNKRTTDNTTMRELPKSLINEIKQRDTYNHKTDEEKSPTASHYIWKSLHFCAIMYINKLIYEQNKEN